MTRVSREAFRGCLDGLDVEKRTAFVAAVYDARGWETTRDGGDLRVTPPGVGESRRVAIRRDADAADDGDEREAETVDADAIRQMVLYAVDAETRERLFRQFFDRDPSELADDTRTEAVSAADDPPGSEATETGRDATPPANGRAEEGTHQQSVTGSADGRHADTSDRPAGNESRRDGVESTVAASAGRTRNGDAGDESLPAARWLAVGLATAIVVGGVLAAVGPELASSAVDGDAASGGGENGTASPAVMDRDGLPVAPDMRQVVTDGKSTPPGVNSTGVTDAATLADAHEAALSEQSYRLDITYREVEDGELRGVAHERVVVESADHYRSQVRRLGSLRHESSVIASGPMYANGSTGYVRTGEEIRERTDVPGRMSASPDTLDFVDRTERLVRWYLSVERSQVVEVTAHGGTTTYRIGFEGDPWPDSRNVTGWARVDERGLVHELHREYTPASESDVRIEVTIRIEPGPVTVTRPEWMDAATDESERAARLAPGRAASVDPLVGGLA